MTTPSESILAANCVIRSLKKPHDLYCAICTTDEYSDDWKKHIEDPRHTMNLKRYNLVFDGHGSTTTLCKFCNERFAWDALKNHAEWHRIVPWYKPDDLNKRFFENHFFQWENKFYCHFCDNIFFEWYTAFLHISNEKHYRTIRKEPHYDDFSLDANFSYESLIQDGLSSSGVSLLRCRICDCANMVFGNIGQHLNGKKHANLKNQLIDTLNKRNNSKNVEKSVKKQENIIDCDYIAKSLNNKLSCKICDVEFLDYSSVDKHIKGSLHVSALKKYGCNNISSLDGKADEYRCDSCDCFLTSRKYLYDHVKSKKHLNSINASDKQKKKIEETSSTPSVTNSVASRNYEIINAMPCNYIVKLDDMFHRCEICEIKLSGKKTIEDHRAGKRHVAAFQNYGCFFIIFMDNNYYCKCCECKIFGVINVYLHVKGKPHDKSLNEFGCRNIVLKDGNYYCKCCKCKISGLVNVFLHAKGKRHLATLNESENETEPAELKSSNVSQVKKTRKSRKRQPKSLRLKTVPIVNNLCDVCNITVSDSAELHTHLALHFSEGFNTMINGKSENEENERDFNASSESTSTNELTIESEQKLSCTSSDDDDTNESDLRSVSSISLNSLWREYEGSD